MIQAVLFDMDGVMFDTERIYNDAWQYGARRQGREISYETILAVKGSCRAVTARILKKELGEAFDVESAVEDRDRFTREYIEENGLPLKPGLMELLRYLREQEIKTSLASSTKLSIVRHYFDLAHLDPFFDAIVCGSMVERGKPEPDIFLAAAERLGVPAEKAVVLEDSLNGNRTRA